MGKLNYESFTQNAPEHGGERLYLLIIERKIKADFFKGLDLKKLIDLLSLDLFEKTNQKILTQVDKKDVYDIIDLLLKANTAAVQKLWINLKTEKQAIIYDYLVDCEEKKLATELLEKLQEERIADICDYLSLEEKNKAKNLLNNLQYKKLIKVYNFLYQLKQRNLVDYTFRLLFKKQENYSNYRIILTKNRQRQHKKAA